MASYISAGRWSILGSEGIGTGLSWNSLTGSNSNQVVTLSSLYYGLSGRINLGLGSDQLNVNVNGRVRLDLTNVETVYAGTNNGSAPATRLVDLTLMNSQGSNFTTNGSFRSIQGNNSDETVSFEHGLAQAGSRPTFASAAIVTVDLGGGADNLNLNHATRTVTGTYNCPWGPSHTHSYSYTQNAWTVYQTSTGMGAYNNFRDYTINISGVESLNYNGIVYSPGGPDQSNISLTDLTFDWSEGSPDVASTTFIVNIPNASVFFRTAGTNSFLNGTSAYTTVSTNGFYQSEQIAARATAAEGQIRLQIGTSTVDSNTRLFIGTAGHDAALTASTTNPTAIYGFTGNDVLNGNSGADTLFGGDGGDTLTGGEGSDRIEGNADNDEIRSTITLLVAGDTIDGGAGTDNLLLTTNGTVVDAVFANKSNLEILTLANGGTNTITLSSNAVASFATLTVNGGDGNDSITTNFGTEAITVNGGAGDDTIDNDDLDVAADSLVGGAGNDSIWGGGGNDTILGGNDADSINGENNQDVIWAGLGADAVDATELTGSEAVDKVIVVGNLNTADATKITLINTTLNSMLGYNPGLTTAYTTDIAAGESITFDTSGLDQLHAFGTVDFSGATITNPFVLFTYSSLTLTQSQLNLAREINLVGSSTHTLTITDDDGNAMSAPDQIVAFDTWLNQAGLQLKHDLTSQGPLTVAGDTYGYTAAAAGYTGENIAVAAPTSTPAGSAIGSSPNSSTLFFDTTSADDGSSTPFTNAVTVNYQHFTIDTTDRFMGAQFISNFEPGTTLLPVPDTFLGTGDNRVHNRQFEVYYGNYDPRTDIFSVTSLPSSQVQTPYTLILYDNDTSSNVQFVEGLVFANFMREPSWVLANGGTANATLSFPSGSLVSSGSYFTTIGTTGNNTLTGGANTEYLYGLAGDDVLTGVGGGDFLIAGEGADTVTGGAGLNVIDLGDDTIGTGFGDGDADVVIINAVAGTSSDSGPVIAVGNGNDAGQDVIYNFDASVDTIRLVVTSVGDFDHATAATIGTGTPAAPHRSPPVSASGTDEGAASSFTNRTLLVDLNANANFGNAGDVAITFINNSGSISTGVLQYNLTGTVGNNTITTGALNDTINGGDGADTITGGAGVDVIDGGNGDDVFIYATLAEFITSGAIVDTITGGNETDTIRINQATAFTIANSDSFARAGTVETLAVGAANAGAISISLNADAFTAGIRTITLAADTNSTGNNIIDASTAIAGQNLNLVGSAGVDSITGGAGDDTILGGNGDDRINGAGGNDSIDAGNGNDTVTFDMGVAADIPSLDGFIDGGDGTDTMYVWRGDTTNLILTDADFANVRNMELLTLYHTNSHPISVTLAANASIAFSTGITISKTGGTTLTVDGSAFTRAITVTGDTGNDTFIGGSGIDVIIGGAGRDSLTGGGGLDLFIIGTGDDAVGESYSGGVDFAELRVVDTTTVNLSDDTLDTLNLLELTKDAAGASSNLVQTVTLTAIQRTSFGVSLNADSTDLLFVNSLNGLAVDGTSAKDTFVFDAADTGITLNSLAVGDVLNLELDTDADLNANPETLAADVDGDGKWFFDSATDTLSYWDAAGSVQTIVLTGVATLSGGGTTALLTVAS